MADGISSLIHTGISPGHQGLNSPTCQKHQLIINKWPNHRYYYRHWPTRGSKNEILRVTMFFYTVYLWVFPSLQVTTEWQIWRTLACFQHYEIFTHLRSKRHLSMCKRNCPQFPKYISYSFIPFIKDQTSSLLPWVTDFSF